MSATSSPAAAAASRRTPGRALLYAVLILFAVYYLLPLFVMLVNSVKPLSELSLIHI